MAKKKLTLSLDEIVIKRAKEEIPNLSKLVEETLRTYLDTQDSDEFRIRTQIKAEEEQRGRSERQIELLEAQLKLRRQAKYGEKSEQNRAWRDVWDKYRNNIPINEETWENTTHILGWDKERLDELMETMKLLGRHINAVKAMEWEYAKEQEGEL